MTNPTNNTAPANTTVNKTSTMETLKDKASNLVHMVTGKGHTNATHHNTDTTTSTAPDYQNQHEQHKNLDGTTSTKHGDVNPSAFLSSVRIPDDGAGAGSGMAAAAPSNITQPEAVHNPNQHHHNAGILPTHSANTTANPNVAGMDGTHVQHQQHDHALGEHGHQHKLDDPQHGITSRLSGQAVGGDPNLAGSASLHPVM